MTTHIWKVWELQPNKNKNKTNKKYIAPNLFTKLESNGLKIR